MSKPCKSIDAKLGMWYQSFDSKNVMLFSMHIGVPIPTPTRHESPLPEDYNPVQKERHGRINQLIKQLHAKDAELEAKSNMLEESKKEKSVLNHEVTTLKQNIDHTHIKSVKLINEKLEIEKQLELKKQEIELLKSSHSDKSQHFQSIITQREEEISQLKEQLRMVEGQLSSERKKAQDLREQFNQVERELAAESARAQELEKSNGKLEANLESTRKRVELLLMENAAASSNQQQHTRELEVCSVIENGPSIHNLRYP